MESLRSLESGVWSHSLEAGAAPETRGWSPELLRSVESGFTPEPRVWSLESLRSLESGVWSHSGV